MALSALQMDYAFAMTTTKTEKADFVAESQSLEFATEKDSEYRWVCTGENLNACTVSEAEVDEKENGLQKFSITSKQEGMDVVNFMYQNANGENAKIYTYKMEVSATGKLTSTLMAYYGEDGKSFDENYYTRSDEPAFFIPKVERGVGGVKIENKDIVRTSSVQNFVFDSPEGSIWKVGASNGVQQLLTLEAMKPGTTTVTLIYSNDSKTSIEYFQLAYKVTVDEKLQINVEPTVHKEEDPGVGTIVTQSFGTTGHLWSYEFSDEKIATITDQWSVNYNSYGIGGGWTTFYKVEALQPGTTYVRFTYARGLHGMFGGLVEVADSALYKVDVDESKHIAITKIEDSQLPGDVDLPQVTSSPAIMEKYHPEYSNEPTATPNVTTAPAINSPVPQVTTSPAIVTEEPKETPEVTEVPKETEIVPTPVITPIATEPAITPIVTEPAITPIVTGPAITPVATEPAITPVVTGPTISPSVTTGADVTATPKPQVTKEPIKSTEPPKNVTMKKVTVGKVKIGSAVRKSVKKATVKWKKIKSVKGYQITVATDKKFKKNVKKKNVSGTQTTISWLKKGKKYYVKVRAYKLDSKGKKVYGQYSDVKTIKVK